jgi:PST family polysaccharide transporter
MKPSLGRAAGRGVVYLGLSQAWQIICTIVSTLIVARILSPADYGVVAMAGPITGFILIFQNLGLNQALVQSKSLDEDQINALFWYNMAASVVIGIIFLLLSPVVAWFYSDGRPAEIMAASALTVLVSGSMLQHMALLNRAMRYRALSLISIVGSTSGLLLTIVLAEWLRSYWAIFLGTFGGTALSCCFAWWLNPWRPRFVFSARGTRGLLVFGANVTGFNVLNYLSRNIDNVLIAKVWGAAQLGLYDRSYRLMMFPLQNINMPLSRVMLPTLSRLYDDEKKFRRVYVSSIRALALFSVPGVMACALCSHEVVILLLGDRWAEADKIFFWLSLAAITQPVGNATGWLFMSSGRAGAMMRWGMVSTPITIASFLIGLPWGASGVAAAYFFSQALRLPILYRWCSKGTPVQQSDFYYALLPTLAAGIVSFFIVYACRGTVPQIALVLIALGCCYLLSAAAQAATANGRSELKELANLIRTTLLRRSGTPDLATDGPSDKRAG